MIRKIFDRYYLVLMRAYDNWYGEGRRSASAADVIAISITFNIVSLSLIFGGRNFLYIHSVWGLVATVFIYLALVIVLNIVYNKKRRDKLREMHEDEEDKDRQRGVAEVVAYETICVFLFILAMWMVAKNAPPRWPYR